MICPKCKVSRTALISCIYSKEWQDLHAAEIIVGNCNLCQEYVDDYYKRHQEQVAPAQETQNSKV